MLTNSNGGDKPRLRRDAAARYIAEKTCGPFAASTLARLASMPGWPQGRRRKEGRRPSCAVRGKPRELMAPEMANPAAPVTATAGLGMLVSAVAARDTRGFTAPLPYVQAAFLSRRFGLSPERARVVAGLAFDGGGK